MFILINFAYELDVFFSDNVTTTKLPRYTKAQWKVQRHEGVSKLHMRHAVFVIVS